MATNAVKGGNVTKYDAGGSGDNVIGDGYIKATEKVWLDNYTLTGNITLTNTTISIATLQPNKKLTSIEIVINTSISQTSGTIGLGFSSEADAAAWGSLMAETNITHNLTTTTISWPGVGITNNLNAANGVPKIGGFQEVTAGTRVTIAIKLNNWTMSTGTLKTIVRYT
jgi:hypothetical protein